MEIIRPFFVRGGAGGRGREIFKERAAGRPRLQGRRSSSQPAMASISGWSPPAWPVVTR